MDPVTAITIANTAFLAIKKGFQVGKDVESMSKDIGRWMGAINAVKKSHAEEKKKRKFGTIEEEALETFAAKKRAERMEEELRVFIMMNYGPNAWAELLRLQAAIRKRELIEKEQRAKRIEEIRNWIFVSILLIIVAAGILFIGMFIRYGVS